MICTVLTVLTVIKVGAVLTGKNCSVSNTAKTGEVCVPTLKTTCATENMQFFNVEPEEKCIKVSFTSCHAFVTTETIQLCAYVYENKELSTWAKVSSVPNHTIAEHNALVSF